ncbi:MAG: hypothetical protein AABZ45_01885 [Pseudomonadota bacterium]
MTPTHIRVVYAGPAVEDGEMDVSQFASSLLALGKLIENADSIRTGEAGRVKVRVRSDLKRGSFDVGIAVHWLESLKDATIAWALTPEGAGTLALLGFLGLNVKDVAVFGGKGVLQTVRWLKGRRIAQKTVLIDGNTELVTDDGDMLTVDTVVAQLVDEPTIRQPLEKFTEPLREDGVEEIRFEDISGDYVEKILAAEADNFAANAGSDPTSSDTFRATYQIKRLFFERGRKWRLSSGAQTITAEIEDEQFWHKVESSQMAFAKEDYLVCVVRMDQWFSPNGLKTEYTVEKVEQHIPSPKQANFPDL